MTIKVKTTYLEADTKFYETVLLLDDRGPAMLIKRWGKLELKKGGGQTLIMRGTHVALQMEERKIVGEKTKKGYTAARTLQAYGLHVYNNGALDVNDTVKAAKKHYSDLGEPTAILEHFGGGEPDPTPAPASVATAEPVLERGDSWGTF